MSVFASPASGGGETFKAAEHVGHLLIVSPLDFKTGIVTAMGDADAISCDIVDLTDGVEFKDVLLFGAALKASLRSRIGQKVLATLGQGPAKPGKSAPWILIDATGDAEAVKRATDYLAGGLSQPAPAAAAAPAPAVPAGVNLNDPAIQALMAQLGAQTVAQ